MSGIDREFITRLEGNRSTAYVPDSGKSGVTIGMGLDLGNFGNLDALDIPSELQRKLLPYVGARRGEATRLLDQRPLSLSDREVEQLNSAVINYKEDKVKALYESSSGQSWNDMTQEQRTVVYSVIHQYGNPRRVPKFWEAVTSGDWTRAESELRDFGDAYASRRNQEADLLAQRDTEDELEEPEMRRKYTPEDVMMVMDRVNANRKRALAALKRERMAAVEQREVGMMEEAMRTGVLPPELEQMMATQQSAQTQTPDPRKEEGQGSYMLPTAPN